MFKWFKKLWKRLRPKKHITMAKFLKSPKYNKSRTLGGVPTLNCGPITEHMTGSLVGKPWPPALGIDIWCGVDPKLPRECPLCGGPNTPSKIDDRMVACFSCKQVYMTSEAFDDPNIQRDITHAQAGIRCSGRNDFNDRDECEEDGNETD